MNFTIKKIQLITQNGYNYVYPWICILSWFFFFSSAFSAVSSHRRLSPSIWIHHWHSLIILEPKAIYLFVWIIEMQSYSTINLHLEDVAKVKTPTDFIKSLFLFPVQEQNCDQKCSFVNNVGTGSCCYYYCYYHESD